MTQRWSNFSQGKNLTFHFVGIGGIGMSALAYFCLHNGFHVQGSTLGGDHFILEQLQKMGGKIFYSHAKELISDTVDCVVTTSGISPYNPELQEAEKRGIPIFHRSDFLRIILEEKNVLAVAGTHGKTTTTALLGTVLDHVKMDPTIFCGGIMNIYKNNLRISASPWAVVEADEHDKKSLLNFENIWGGIVTNIEAEHLENYESFEDLIENFGKFLSKISHKAAVCWDDENIRTLSGKYDFSKKVISYGFHPDAHVQGQNVRHQKDGSIFDVLFQKCDTQWKDVNLSLKGLHNVSNALAVIALSREIGVTEEKIREAFRAFQGVKRRLTLTGTSNDISVFDDYAHHPSEIHTTLHGIRLGLSPQQKIIAICQPHRYTRLHAHMETFATCFTHADIVLVLPIYSANEEEIPGTNSTVLWEKLCKNGIKAFLEHNDSPEIISSFLLHHAAPGDIVVCMGAGTITNIAHALPQAMNNGSSTMTSSYHTK